MARVYIGGHLMLQYSTGPEAVYWGDVSSFISGRYGRKPITQHELVESVLFDSFQFMADKFKSLIYDEVSLSFYLHVHYLHEQSIKIHQKASGGISLYPISQIEFAMYRRILKNILEQGCDVDMNWGEFPTGLEENRIDAKIEDLLYLGRWLYDLADAIALHKMVNSFFSISFPSKGLMVIDPQYHYAELYKALLPQLQPHYENSIYDKRSVQKLTDAIKTCFGIEYVFARDVIFKIKALFGNSDFQTIQPHILPQNLVHRYGITLAEAKRFYYGLTLSRSTKMTLEDSVYKPYNMNRFMFRPILIYRIGGEDRALVGYEKFTESIFVISTNAIHWNALPMEWLQNRCMKQFVNTMGNDHDKILEDAIELKVRDNDLLFVRNIKSFKQAQDNNINIDSAVAGEIDFIIINEKLKKVFVADSKYNRARYEAVGYRNDYTLFVEKYEPKIEKKANWVKDNLRVVTAHFKIIYNRQNLDLTGFRIEAVFFINTPTFYMFNGKFKAVTLHQVSKYLLGQLVFKTFAFINKDPTADNQYDIIDHPYFKH